MQLTAIEEGTITFEIHWCEARLVAEELKHGKTLDDYGAIGGVSVDVVNTLATAFEGATMAGRLQFLSAEAEYMTLEHFRKTCGAKLGTAPS